MIEQEIPSDAGELFCMAESKDEAEKTAKLYGIELISFECGVAVFHTEEDIAAVIERGQANSWPELNINNVKELLN